MKKLIIIGNSLFAEIAFEYFDTFSDFEIMGFVVSEKFLKGTDSYLGKPLVGISSVQNIFSPKDYFFFAAQTYGYLNNLRAEFFYYMSSLGYSPASFISEKCFISPSVKLGVHNFIFENNVLQTRVQLGDNNVLWSGNHIGHHSIMGHNNFISSHCVIGGNVSIGRNNFIGLNSSISNDIEIGDYNLLGSNVFIDRKISSYNCLKSKGTTSYGVGTSDLFDLNRKFL